MAYPKQKEEVHPWTVQFFRGGCLDYAHATLDALCAIDGSEGELVGVFLGSQPDHVLVFIGDKFIDALGMHSRNEVVDFWSKELGGLVTLRSVCDDDLIGYTEDEERYENAYEDIFVNLQ